MKIDYFKQALIKHLYDKQEMFIQDKLKTIIQKAKEIYPTATHFVYKGKIFPVYTHPVVTKTEVLPKQFHNDIFMVYQALNELSEEKNKFLYEFILLRKLLPIEQNYILFTLLPDTLKHALQHDYNPKLLQVDLTQLPEELSFKLSHIINLIEDRLMKNLLS